MGGRGGDSDKGWGIRCKLGVKIFTRAFDCMGYNYLSKVLYHPLRMIRKQIFHYQTIIQQ
jgi:hypothetical protein